MARQFIFIVAVFWIHLAFGQGNNSEEKTTRPATEKESKIQKRNQNCIKQTNKSFTIRLRNYPFNLSTQIQLVSFRGIDTSKDQDMIDVDSLPRQNDTVCYSKLKEVKNLTFKDVDKLTDILYNFGYQGQTWTPGVTYIGTMTQCYNPRNAILFLDKNGKAFEFIEICFECRKTRESSQKIFLGQMCEQKLDMFKDFFKTVGIEYGIKKDVVTDN